jgi:probable addiction module antidote protein
MGVKLIPFDAADFLKDEKTVAEYLNACMETGDSDVMLSALSAVARARGMADLADRAGVNRESLYKALAPGAKPRYDTIFKVVRALGIDMVFRAPPAIGKAPARTAAPGKARAKGASAKSRKTASTVERRASASSGAAPEKRR